jgi:hypothetical protein
MLTLQGAINRHKDAQHQQPQNDYAQGPPSSYRGRGGSRPYQRPLLPLPIISQLGSRASYPYNVSRHRTLIVNQPPHQDPSSPTDPQPPGTTGQWIQKRDRHMQLINAAVYADRTQARQTEITQTKEKAARERRERKDKRERQMLFAFLERRGRGNRVSVLGNLFRVTAGGNKLEKFQGMKSSCSLGYLRGCGMGLMVDNGVATPRRIKVGGVAFHRSKNGNYWRRGVIVEKSALLPCQRNPNPRLPKTDILCQHFTKTGTPNPPFTPFFFVFVSVGWVEYNLSSSGLGSCSNGSSCPYLHNPDKLALCPAYAKDTCPNTPSTCPLSHNSTAHNAPSCHHFTRGHCDKGPLCKFGHIKLSPTARICPDFARSGWCERGETCDKKHSFECPEFSETGKCSRKGCRLQHVDTALTARKRGERDKAGEGDDVDGESGEEEDKEDEEEEEEGSFEESDVESEGYVDDGERFEDNLDFMHL